MPGVTIRDVALAAGVSVSTVSRVFSRPDLFREETRSKVHAAASALKYSPNRSAASLTTGRTANVGLVVPNLANPVFPEMIKAAQRSARTRGLAALLVDSDDSAEDEETLLYALAKDVDGLIDFSSLLSDTQIASVGPLRPIVFVNRVVEGYRSVLVDTEHGMALLTNYLANLGHSSILYVPGPENSWMVHDRIRALEAAAAEAAIDVEISAWGPATFETGSAVAERIVHGRMPTAVMCFNDVIALGVVARLLQLGFDVPGQVSVTGWGGTKLAGHTTPSLTTLATPLAELGTTAVEQLLLADSGDGVPAGPVLLEGTLLARASTGRARQR